MNFNKHSNLEGQHAFLSASQYHWLNYDREKIAQAYSSFLAKKKGTDMHALACECIRLGVNLPRNKKAINQYVNDAISLHMQPEQVLYYSENCFGTADCISFCDSVLHIHDLKTGRVKASMQQLYIYAALFCLEYGITPTDISFDLRIYQGNDIETSNPSGEHICSIMDHIIYADRELEQLKIGDNYG